MGTNEPFNVFIGFDSREAVGTYVAAHSIRKRSKSNLNIQQLNHRKLRSQGIFTRPWLISGDGGESTDLIDGKKFSTEFSHTRFLVPHLMQHKGWALFMDADMIFLSDIKKLFALADDRYAMMCVKHHYPQNEKSRKKMDNRTQAFYARKNWSSFVLWNCAHPANKELTAERVNTMRGADLHAFSWLEDGLIGTLPYTYNYIMGISPKLPPENGVWPDVIHYTEGGPWFDECQDVPFAQTWIDEYEDWQNNGIETNRVCEVKTTRHEL